MHYDTHNWDTVQVPGSWQMQGYDQSQYCNVRYPWEGHEDICPPAAPTKHNPVGCYVKRIHVGADLLQKRVVLCFEGVESAFISMLTASGWATVSPVLIGPSLM